MGGLHPQPDLKSRAIGRAVGDGRARQRRRSRGAPGGRASARWSRVTRPRRRSPGGLAFVPGDSNMKVTTSPVSSAFIVMMSSLPAHLSILDCGREARGRGKGTRGQERSARRGRGGESLVATRGAARERSRARRRRVPGEAPRGGPRAPFFKTNAFSRKTIARRRPVRAPTHHVREVHAHGHVTVAAVVLEPSDRSSSATRETCELSIACSATLLEQSKLASMTDLDGLEHLLQEAALDETSLEHRERSEWV